MRAKVFPEAEAGTGFNASKSGFKCSSHRLKLPIHAAMRTADEVVRGFQKRQNRDVAEHRHFNKRVRNIGTAGFFRDTAVFLVGILTGRGVFVEIITPLLLAFR